MLDGRRLTYFLTVAELLHFRKAAERLHIAQPALSQQIRRLEDELDCRLFRRDRRRVELTPAGQALLDTGRRALAHLASATEAVRHAADRQNAILRIGFVSPASFAVVPDVLRRLRRAHPNIYLVLREGDTSTLLDEVRHGVLDVAYVRGPVTASGVRIETLRRESLAVVLPSGHRLARRVRVPVRELSREDFIGFPRASAPSLHDAITGLCLDAGFAPCFVTEATEWHTIVSLVAAGLGVAVLPESVRTFSRRGAVYRSLAGKPPQVDLVMATRPEVPTEPLRQCLEITRR